ncbi:uroporphyrinogen-III synthase [bacterium BMS3Bbin12]|nr:uroporphyrinogen-III synthase [bacterium BMS3Abin12]GBE48856.1 uroporphyrinogen-III synthase [bacterium BMS3Bbin12]GBE49760.1 uroporphyrinogen-III synthase [bacterium BMS3Bbin13]HDK03743.1 uroporphyrinogen-III synthase [Gammaproteobacteria bacterium]
MARSPGETAPLAGVGILVTRPAHQSEPLCRRIEAAGGCAIRFPVLEILDPADPGPLLSVIERIEEFDLAIFISSNAVTRTLNRLPGRRPLPPTLRIAAIGRGSAKELARAGVPADIVPAPPFNSEALLATEAMQAVAGRRIVIFRGDGGRELLGDELRRRGARVEYAEAYRRARPDADVGRVLRHWVRGELQIVTVTSSEGLRNLFELTGRLGRQWLCRTPLVTVSERTAALARELGCRESVTVAREASDEALVAAVGEWVRRRHD